MPKRLSLYIGILIGILTLITMGYKYDERLAKAEDVNKSIQKLSIRLEQKIQEDRLSNIQERIWALEDRYGTDKSKMPPDACDAYRRLVDEKQKTLRTLSTVNVDQMEIAE